MEGEVANRFAVGFRKTQPVTRKAFEEDTDGRPSISGAGAPTQLLVSQCRKL